MVLGENSFPTKKNDTILLAKKEWDELGILYFVLGIFGTRPRV